MSYQQKYLKYKKKYLELNTMKGGGKDQKVTYLTGGVQYAASPHQVLMGRAAMQFYTMYNCANSIACKTFNYNDFQPPYLIKCTLIPVNNDFYSYNSYHRFIVITYNIDGINLTQTFSTLHFVSGKILATIEEEIEVHGYGDMKKKMKKGDPYWYYEFDNNKTLLITTHSNSGTGTDTGTRETPPDILY